MKNKPFKRAGSDASVVETRSADHFGDGFTYVRRFVSCGKSACKACFGEAYRHGPYWYGVRWAPEKRRKKGDGSGDTRPTAGRYVGRELQPVDAPKPKRERRQLAGRKPSAAIKPPARLPAKPPARLPAKPPARPAAGQKPLRQALSKKAGKPAAKRAAKPAKDKPATF
jgi:hypothetical protein